MIPKTQLIKRIVEVHSKLPDITDEQFDWGFDSLFTHKGVISRKTTLNCLECGHHWKDDSHTSQDKIVIIECPDCGKELKFKKYDSAAFKDTSIMGILTTVDEFQIVRIIYLEKHTKKKTPAFFFGHEAIQHWIAPDGRVISYSKRTQGFGMYFDSWIKRSDLTLKKDGLNSNLYNVVPWKIYPKKKIHPTLKRNGFKGSFYDMAPHKLFSVLMANNKAETLLKAKQIPLMKYFCQYPDSETLDKYWNAIKICMRNNYIIKDASDWIDTMNILSFFNKDLTNSKFVCPENLEEFHNHLVAKKRLYNRKLKRASLKKEIEKDQKKYEKEKGKFFGLEFDDDDLNVRVIDSVNDIMKEGDLFNHCVFENEFHKKSKTLLLSAKFKNEPVEITEVSLEDFKVIQSRGQGNKASPYNKRILNLVQNNMHQIQSRINH